MTLRLCDIIVQRAKQYWEGHPVIPVSTTSFTAVNDEAAITAAINEMFSSHGSAEHDEDLAEASAQRGNLTKRLRRELWPDQRFVPNAGDRVIKELALMLKGMVGNYEAQMREREELAQELTVHPDLAKNVNVAACLK